MKILLKLFTALILALLFLSSTALSIDLNDSAVSFYDISENHENFHAIKYLSERNIFIGYPDGTFHPDAPINRAELTKIVIAGQDLTPEIKEYNNCFNDVKKQWFSSYICYSKNKGWINGYPDNNFRPENTLTLAEGLKIIQESYQMPYNLHLESEETNQESLLWYFPYLNLAEDMNIIDENVDHDPDSQITRSQAAEYLYRTILLSEYKDKYNLDKWLDTDGEVFDFKSYSGIANDLKYKFKITYKDVQISFNEVPQDQYEETGKISSQNTEIKEDCPISNVSDCYAIKVDDEIHELQFRGDELIALNYYDQTTSELHEYTQPILLLSNHNFLKYTKDMALPATTDVEAFDWIASDSVYYSEFIGYETLQTSLGSYDTVKRRNFAQAKVFFDQNDINTEVLFTIEVIEYLAKNIGPVKQEVHVKALGTDGLIVINFELEKELIKAEGI